MALSVVAIKAAEIRGKAYKLSDRDGLYLLVTPSGGRYWRMNYRHFGKQKTLAFGVWPDTGLAEARAECDAARKVLARGEDPAERIRLDRVEATVAASNSFEAVADEWLSKVEKEGRSPVTMKKLRWLLGFINASIGKRPIAAISAQELLLMLRKMEGNARYETAKRLRSTCSQVFRYAIATARAERDVAADLRGALVAPKPAHRAAVTTPKAAGELLRAIEGFQGQPNTLAALRLLPYVLASYVSQKGRTSIWNGRSGPFRRARRKCGGPMRSPSPARRSRSLPRLSTTQTIAAISSHPSAPSESRCRRTRSMRHSAGWDMRRTK
jgi:hypothetical protein